MDNLFHISLCSCWHCSFLYSLILKILSHRRRAGFLLSNFMPFPTNGVTRIRESSMTSMHRISFWLVNTKQSVRARSLPPVRVYVWCSLHLPSRSSHALALVLEEMHSKMLSAESDYTCGYCADFQFFFSSSVCKAAKPRIWENHHKGKLVDVAVFSLSIVRCAHRIGEKKCNEEKHSSRAHSHSHAHKHCMSAHSVHSTNFVWFREANELSRNEMWCKQKIKASPRLAERRLSQTGNKKPERIFGNRKICIRVENGARGGEEERKNSRMFSAFGRKYTFLCGCYWNCNLVSTLKSKTWIDIQYEKCSNGNHSMCHCLKYSQQKFPKLFIASFYWS